MKTDLTLGEMAAELERQKESKRDFLADTRRMEFAATSDGLILRGAGLPDDLTLQQSASRQLATHTGIPAKYWDKMQADAPDLLATNANHWLHNSPAKRLIRTLDGRVRAFLSDSYRPMDNYDLATAVLPVLTESKIDARIESAALTEDRFYLKAVSSRIEGEAKEGDTLQAGIVISNSEVGAGALRIEELDFRLVCSNGMIRAIATRKTHVGKRNGNADLIENAREAFSTQTKNLEDQAFWHKVQDAARFSFDENRFQDRLCDYRDAAEIRIPDPVDAVEMIGKRFDLPETDTKGILSHLIEGGDLSAWGLANAVTRYSQDVDEYAHATDLESLGGDIIELAPSEWSVTE